MMLSRLLAAVTLVVAATCSAFAADVVFPPGARVGMKPLVGLVKAKTFAGFETEDQGVKVLVTDLPAEAYGEVAGAFKANPGGTGGVKPESIDTAAGLAYYTVENARDGASNVRRYSMILPGPTFSGYVAVQVPENASKIYTDDAIRQMFATAEIRTEVPVDEQLGLMPFKIGELSNFRNVRTLAPGAALILADGDEKAGFEAAPFMIIGIIGSTAASPDDRGRFAQQIATTIPGVQGWPDHDVRTGPHRWPARLRDAHRRGQRQGQYPRYHRAVAAVRRAELAAHHRVFAARRLVESVPALPQRARRYPAALITSSIAPFGHDPEKRRPVFQRDHARQKMDDEDDSTLLNHPLWRFRAK